MAADHFREVSELLFGAGGRYRTARATIAHRRRGDLATEAEARYVEYAHRRGILSNFDPPYDVPRYREYADLEEVSRLWHERPGRWRQETEAVDGPETVYRVADGKGPWWYYAADGRAHYSPANDGGFSPDGELSCLLDPYEVRYSLGECDLRISGRAEKLGRETVEVVATVVSWDYAGPFLDGADDYLLSVDAEIGVILRVASRLREEECEVFGVTGLAFDEAFPEGTFVLDLPGVEFEMMDPPG
ncbi:MAG TPA: hypothetical protein VKA73_09925 [Rubrobacter sp.]|nr:hypothetical protein [Rubrobacter sp.]